jgi:hypothetical protein
MSRSVAEHANYWRAVWDEFRNWAWEVGAEVAQHLLASRAGDGRNDIVTYVPGSDPGVWVPTQPGRVHDIEEL